MERRALVLDANMLKVPPPGPPQVEELFSLMEDLVPGCAYPSEVPRITQRIQGTSFFPGGWGLHLEGRNPNEVRFPVGGVMILGHNYDSEAGFKKSVERGGEDLTRGTWGSLQDLLGAADVPVDACFFTNAFMGLCKGSDNKSYRGRSDPNFRAACLRFLLAQIEVQRPRLIVTLGVKVPPFLAIAADELVPWRDPKRRRSCDREIRLRDLDATPIFKRVTFVFNEGSTHSCAVTGIAHPSDRRNGARRVPKGFAKGNAGEVNLIRAGWALGGSSGI